MMTSEPAAPLREILNTNGTTQSGTTTTTAQQQQQQQGVVQKAKMIDPDQEYTNIVDSGQDFSQVRHECAYGRCQARIWFPGFSTAEDLWTHQQLHRCQWLVYQGEDLYRPCQYLPRSEDDFVNHVEYHLNNDRIPTGRSSDTNRVIYFCPWQTCTSLPYANKGATNRAHIVDHIRKHCQ